MLTDDETFLRLSLSVVPRWSTSGVDGPLSSAKDRLGLGGILRERKGPLPFGTALQRIDLFRKQILLRREDGRRKTSRGEDVGPSRANFITVGFIATNSGHRLVCASAYQSDIGH